MGQSHGVLKAWVTLWFSLSFCFLCPCALIWGAIGAQVLGSVLEGDGYPVVVIGTFIPLGGKQAWGVGGDEWGCFFPSRRMEWWRWKRNVTELAHLSFGCRQVAPVPSLSAGARAAPEP